MKRASLFVALTLLSAACSESGDGDVTSSSSSTTTSSTATATSGAGGASSTGTTSSTSTSTSSSGGASSSGVVINEISASGDDWVELANPTAAAIDLGGFSLCDSDSSGACDTTTAVVFPTGTSIAAHGYVFILGKQDAAAGVGPQTMCLSTGGPATCYYATWGISDSKGEKIFLEDAGGHAVDEGDFRANATTDGQTWCRLPDASGPFAVCTPTPGDPNKS